MSAVDIATAAKVGGTLFAQLKSAAQLPEPVDRRDGLYELHEILNEWTRLANSSVTKLKAASTNGAAESAWVDGSDWNGPSFLEVTSAHLAEIWAPPPPLLIRWRTSARRKAARRGLRTILAVHAPDLAAEFDDVTNARLRAMETYEQTLSSQDFDDLGPDGRARMIEDLERTATALAELTEHIRQFILRHYRFSDQEVV